MILITLLAIIMLIFVVSCNEEKKETSGKTTDTGSTVKTTDTGDAGKTPIEKKTSLIPAPKKIQGTILNTRPIVYKKGTQGGTLVLPDYGGDPKTFNNTQANETSSTDIIGRFLIGLMDFEEDTGVWRVIPGDYSKGKDGSGYDMTVLETGEQILTFYLRNDIYWSDNTRMTAEDWVWFYNNIECNEDVAAGYPSTLITLDDGSKKQIQAKLLDTFTFQLIYPRVLGEPELQASFVPMPKHILEPVFKDKGAEGIKQLWGIDTPINNLIGNGPWSLNKYEPGSLSSFKRNERYFEKDDWNNKLPYLDGITNRIVADVNLTLALFQNGEVDSLGIQNSDFKTVVESAEAKGYTVWNGGPATGFDFISFNQNPNSDNLKGKPKLKWFTSREFRKAMSLLINRETLILQVFNGLAEPDTTYFHKASPYYDPKIVFDPEYNVQKALSMLEKIGIRDRNGDGIAEDEKGNNIAFELTTNTGNNDREAIINIVAKEWQTYGIKVTPNPMDFNLLVGKLMDSFDWDAVMIALTGDQFPLGGENVYPSNGNLHLWYPNQSKPSTEWEAKVDELFKKAKYEPDFQKRKDYTNQMFKVMYDEMPFIPLARQYIFNAVYNKWDNIFWDVWSRMGDTNQKRLFLKKN